MIFETYLVVQGISAFLQCLTCVYLPFFFFEFEVTFIYLPRNKTDVNILPEEICCRRYGKVGVLTSQYEVCSTGLSLSQNSMFYIIIFRRIGKYHLQAPFKNASNAKVKKRFAFVLKYCISAVLKGEA